MWIFLPINDKKASPDLESPKPTARHTIEMIIQATIFCFLIGYASFLYRVERGFAPGTNGLFAAAPVFVYQVDYVFSSQDI